MHRRTPLIVLGGCAAAIVASAAAPHHPGKLPIIVPAGEVTINGEARPDLGRSFSDSIAGGLIKTGSFTVIDQLGAPEAEDAAPPEAATAKLGEASGAHYAFVPRMIVEEDYYKLSIKKLRISDGEVVDVFESSTISPDRSSMFELLDSTMRLIYNDLARTRAREAKARSAAEKLGAGLELDPRPASSSNLDRPPAPRPEPPAAKPPKPPAPPAAPPAAPPIVRPLPTVLDKTTGRPAGLGAAAQKKPPVPDSEVADAKEATEIAEYAGRVRAVNTDWDFCIIEIARRGMLKVDDELLVRSDTSIEPLGKLRVTKVEGSQVVADSHGKLPLSVVRPGFKVYRWSRKIEDKKKR